MAGSFSDYLEDKVLDHVLKNTAFTEPTNVYCALFTVAPTDAGGGTEVTGGSYVRRIAEDWDVSSGGVTANSAKIIFVQSTADWGTIVAFALFDASTGGDMLMWGDLAADKPMTAGDTVEFIIGALDISLT